MKICGDAALIGMENVKSDGIDLPAPAPPLVLPIVAGLEAPQLNDWTSIHFSCALSVDSPSMPSSLRKKSTAAICSLPEGKRELAARETCRGPFLVGAGHTGVLAGATEHHVAVVCADADDRTVVQVE